jgi:hypothetical protein
MASIFSSALPCMLAAQALALFGKFAPASVILVFGLSGSTPRCSKRIGMGRRQRSACATGGAQDGTPGLAASFLRNTLRADFLPIFYGVGVITMFLCDYQRLGSRGGSTVVVCADEPAVQAADAVNDNEAPPIPLSIAEQRAVIQFTLRAGRATPERAASLACLARRSPPYAADAARSSADAHRALLGRR